MLRIGKVSSDGFCVLVSNSIVLAFFQEFSFRRSWDEKRHLRKKKALT